MAKIEEFEEREIQIQLNTGEGQMSFETDKIMCKLDAILMEADQKVEVIIESEKGYLIFHRHEFEGTHYCAVRARTTASDERLQDSPDFVPYSLNEKLIITIIGPKNTDVNLILRFC